MAHRLLHRGSFMSSRQHGYSLAEMLVVVSILGLLSLVAVPNFVSYYRASKLKTSMRQVTNDLRAARQRAVARNRFVKFSFNDAVSPGVFRIYEARSIGAVTAVTWAQVAPVGGGNKVLEKPVTFENVNFEDVETTDGLFDVIFQSDGTALLPGGVATGALKINTTDPIPVKSYRIAVSSTGKIAASN